MLLSSIYYLMNTILFVKTRDVKSPSYGNDFAAGIDFFIPNDFPITTISPQSSILIPSGIKVSLPSSTMLIAFNKSGVSMKKNLDVGACVVDEDYSGEIHLHLWNVSTEDVTIEPGEKLVQFVLLPSLRPTIRETSMSELSHIHAILGHTRGDGAFGSTGTR